MKKLLLGLVAIVAVFVLVACGGEDDTSQLIGTWREGSGDAFGAEVSGTGDLSGGLEDFREPTEIRFYENGTVVLVQDGVEFESLWYYNDEDRMDTGHIVIATNWFSYEIRGDNDLMTLSYRVSRGGTRTFRRSE